MKNLFALLLVLFSLSMASENCSTVNPWIQGQGYQTGMEVTSSDLLYVNIASGSSTQYCGLAGYAPGSQYGYLCWEYIGECSSGQTVTETKIYKLGGQQSEEVCETKVYDKTAFPLSGPEFIVFDGGYTLMSGSEGSLILSNKVSVKNVSGIKGSSKLAFSPMNTTVENITAQTLVNKVDPIGILANQGSEQVSSVSVIEVNNNDAIVVSISAYEVSLYDPLNESSSVISFSVCYESTGILFPGVPVNYILK
jgi:hypothetical protein